MAFERTNSCSSCGFPVYGAGPMSHLGMIGEHFMAHAGHFDEIAFSMIGINSSLIASCLRFDKLKQLVALTGTASL